MPAQDGNRAPIGYAVRRRLSALSNAAVQYFPKDRFLNRRKNFCFVTFATQQARWLSSARTHRTKHTLRAVVACNTLATSPLAQHATIVLHGRGQGARMEGSATKLSLLWAGGREGGSAERPRDQWVPHRVHLHHARPPGALPAPGRAAACPGARAGPAHCCPGPWRLQRAPAQKNCMHADLHCRHAQMRGACALLGWHCRPLACHAHAERVHQRWTWKAMACVAGRELSLYLQTHSGAGAPGGRLRDAPRRRGAERAHREQHALDGQLAARHRPGQQPRLRLQPGRPQPRRAQPAQPPGAPRSILYLVVMQ